MRTNTASSEIRNYLMLVVVIGTGNDTLNKFVETAATTHTINKFVETAEDAAGKEFNKIKADFWSRSGKDLRDTIFSYVCDENATESLSWSPEEISELWEFSNPNTSQRLIRALGELKWNTNELSDYIGKAISTRSISAAERIASQLPDTLPAGKIGLDEDGDVFLSFHKDDVSVFLTVEPDKLHLLIKSGSEKSRYFDEVPYDDFEIPNTIMEELSKI